MSNNQDQNKSNQQNDSRNNSDQGKEGTTQPVKIADPQKEGNDTGAPKADSGVKPTEKKKV